MWVVLLILKIILYLLLALLLMLINLLVVPFTYKGEAEISGGVSFSYRVGWFWNLFSIRGKRQEELQTTEVYLVNKRLLTVKDRRKEEKEEKAEPDEKEEKAKVKEAKEGNSLRSMFDTKLIREGLEYLKKVLRQLRPKYMHLYGTYGFEDPSITGMTAGFVATMQALWPTSRIHLQPSFTEEILELEFKASGEIVAGQLAFDTARFLLKKDVRKKLFKNRKKLKPIKK